jgi:Tol biopolymer transport system component
MWRCVHGRLGGDVRVTDARERLSAALADRYRIERELGQGGMATVYLVHDLRHDRPVALKVLRAELAAVIGAERFLAEIRTTANLQHPHILPLFDSGTADGFLYYVMPYVEGESLRDRLSREKQLPVEEAIRIATEVASALDYAHRHGVVHRDIKPENILLHEGQALVADFGIALAVTKIGGTRMTETGMSLGTPTYMAPEQAMGEREITPKADVYALGCVLYEMLLGEPPFTGPTAQAVVAKVLTEKPGPIVARRERVPAQVEDAIFTALEKLPADRFASAAEFADALTRTDAARAASRGTVRGAGGAARPWLRDWRSRASLGVAGAALLVGAVLASRGGAGQDALARVAFTQQTFVPQAIFNARFAPDGRTIVYSAALEGNTPHLYVIRPDYPEPSPLGPADTHLLAVSSKGDLAVLVGARFVRHRLFTGTLAQMPLGGGAPREIQNDVREADWSPDGSELAIIHEVGGKDRLEYPVGHVLYESPGYLSDPRVSPRGDRIALFEHPYRWDDRGSVILVDQTARRTVLSQGYDGLEGLAWSPDARTVRFSGGVQGLVNQVREVDPGGRARLVLPSAGTLTMQDVSRSGRWLVTGDDQQDRLMVRAPGERQDRDLSWLDASQQPWLSADGRLMVFTDAGMDAGVNYATMLRKTDGSPVVRLGDGYPSDLSADGRWVLAIIQSAPQQLMLYPTGPGQPRRLDHGELQSFSAARFFPDGQQLLVCGNEPGHASRCYVWPLAGGSPRPVTPEGTDYGFVSPDGREVAAHVISVGFRLYPLDGGPPRTISSLAADDEVVGWSHDGVAIQVYRPNEIPARVDQVDVGTGRRSLLEVIAPADRSGLLSIVGISLARDPRLYAYQTREYVSHLFTIEGMR